MNQHIKYIHNHYGLLLQTPINCYDTDEGSGSILLDESNNLNHGIISGALYNFDIPSPQIAGCTDPYANNYNSDANVDNGTCLGYPEDGSYSLEFDGQDDYISIPDGDHLNIQGDYSWVISGKMNNVNQSQNLFSNNTYYNTDGYYINYLDWDNSVWFSLCSNGTCYQYNSLPNQIIENEWFNLVITKNNGLIQIYIDGQNVTADSWNITQGDDITQYYVDPDAELRIGIDGDDVQPFFGNLDEILLIKEALSEQEIVDYLVSGIMNSDIDIVGNWKLNESSGSTAFDFSGKGNHASLNGPARSQDVPSLSEPYVTVTFNVNMDGVDVSDDGVSMVGVFGSPGDSPMSDDDGDGVWTRTVELEKNSSFSYKFVSCLSWDCMEDLSGQSCATGEWSDRYLETGEQDTTVNAVFGSCESNVSSTTNYALNFDGQDDYVNIDYNENLALNNEMTISGWVKIPSDHSSLWGSVVGGHNGYGYILYAGSNSGSSNGNLWFEVRDGGSVSGTTDLRDNSWTHIAVTYDGNIARAFVDGQLEGENSFETGFQGSPGYPLRFGYVNHNVGNNEHFPGILDELSFYNIALDQSQIQLNMNNELSGLEQGLVGYWNFNSGDGDVLNDQSGNGNNGQINGANWVEGVPINSQDPIHGCTDTYAENYDSDANTDDGSCSYPDNGEYSLSFDNDNVSIGDIGDYSSKVTIMAWVKKDGTNGYSNIVSGGCGNLLFTENDNKILFGSQCSNPIAHDTYGTTDITDNIWHHVAATYDADAGQNNLKVYVDGVLEGQSTKTASFSVNSFRIGSNNNGNGEQYNGNIDMLRIWNTALTQEQIQENMNSSVASVETGLLADWRFNVGDGDILYDHSGNGNHGSINGASWSGEVPVSGCTDPFSENYDPNASLDDGSCEYSQESVTFTKQDYADPSMAENQDRITGNVWITEVLVNLCIMLH